jgi:outer membrane protein OmpA-like peptidoglycan-associated protein
MEQARRQNADLLAPRRFRRAADALAEAESLSDRRLDPDLIGVKLRVALDEIEGARRIAQNARQKLAEALTARGAALSVGADTLGNGNYKRTEESFRALVREFERAPLTLKDGDIQDVAGGFRAARRDALRARLLGEARELIAEAERKNGDRVVPALLLRAHQAMSRAEAYLSQENLDSARADAEAALRAARHALGMLTYIETAQKTKCPWQTALLPYDDLLLRIGARLDSTLDLSRGGVEGAQAIPTLIEAQQESLRAQVTAEQQTIRSLENSLSEAQTSLADAQSRNAELENRLKTAEGARSSAVEQLHKGEETADRLARAQALFNANEGTVLQDRDGNVVIRLLGLRFPPGATKLDKTHSKLLDKAAEALGLFPAATARVEGHTDSEGGEELNQRLSEARAKAVADYLINKLKLPPEKLPAAGYGESRPIAGNDTAEGRARNRRIDIVLTLPR